MYNRYIPQDSGFQPISDPDPVPEEPEQSQDPAEEAPVQKEQEQQQGQSVGTSLGRKLSALLGGGGPTLTGLPGKRTGLSGILPALGLEEIDTGDVILLLILLYLLVEGDDLELVIALGLVLLMGLGKRKEES